MNAKARTARRTIAQRSASTRAAARINRRGEATLTTHCVAAGLTVRAAQSVAGALRNAARKLGFAGHAGLAFRKGQRRDCRRYTRAEVAVIALQYKPRKPAYAAARLALCA